MHFFPSYAVLHSGHVHRPRISGVHARRRYRLSNPISCHLVTPFKMNGCRVVIFVMPSSPCCPSPTSFFFSEVFQRFVQKLRGFFHDTNPHHTHPHTFTFLRLHTKTRQTVTPRKPRNVPFLRVKFSDLTLTHWWYNRAKERGDGEREKAH